jgi:hypothetical protein
MPTIANASWRGFAFWFAAWWAISWLFFYRDSAWTRALEAGGGKLPESQPGFPQIEPQRSLDALAAANAMHDYILWQVLDIPFAFVTVMMTMMAIALGLRATGLKAFGFLLLVPPLYFSMELVENAAVAAFASKTLAPSEGLVLVQQLATTVKAGAGWGSIILALAALVVALIAAAIGLFRKRA